MAGIPASNWSQCEELSEALQHNPDETHAEVSSTVSCTHHQCYQHLRCDCGESILGTRPNPKTHHQGVHSGRPPAMRLTSLEKAWGKQRARQALDKIRWRTRLARKHRVLPALAPKSACLLLAFVCRGSGSFTHNAGETCTKTGSRDDVPSPGDHHPSPRKQHWAMCCTGMAVSSSTCMRKSILQNIIRRGRRCLVRQPAWLNYSPRPRPKRSEVPIRIPLFPTS